MITGTPIVGVIALIGMLPDIKADGSTDIT